MKPPVNNEDQRAYRIAFRIDKNHLLLANIYENLVDRDFKLVEKDIRNIMMDLRFILKSIPEDDF
jgi:hypothetical protein